MVNGCSQTSRPKEVNTVQVGDVDSPERRRKTDLILMVYAQNTRGEILHLS